MPHPYTLVFCVFDQKINKTETFYKTVDPMTKRTTLFIFAGILVILVIVSLTSYFLITRLMDLDTYRARILSTAENSLGRHVSYKTASFSWRHGAAFVFTDVAVREKEADETFLSCKQLAFRLAVIPLLHKEVRVSGIVLESPVISLSRDKSGVFNISDFFRARPGVYKLEVKDILIRNGTVRFADLMSGHEGFAASLENLELYVSGIARGGSNVIKLSAALTGAGERALIVCSGKAEISPDGKPLSETWLDLALSVKDLDAGRFWPYYGRRLPFERIRAIVDFGGVFRGKPTEFASKGGIAVRGLRFTYPGVFRGTLAPRDLRFSFDMGLAPRKLSVNSLDLAVDGLRVKANCSIEDPRGGDPAIKARAATSSFSLAEYRQYIPYGIIAKNTAAFIEKHIAGGIFRLDDGVLDGRVSRILNMDKAGNSNVLSIRGRVEKGIVRFGPRIPVFNNIKGELELGGRDFSLRRISGRFGGSPFTLDGKIADYSLAAPSSYPFSMTITPARDEIAWLLSEGKVRKAVFRGPSVLRLEGSGTVADYRLGGAWNLDRAEYFFPELLQKRTGRVNRLRFGLRLRKTEAELTEMRYKVPPMSLTARAKYRYGAREPLSLAVGTNWFHVDESLPIFPGLQRFKPIGMLHAGINATGNPAETGGMHWRGTVSFEAFSLQHHLQFNQLSNINGTISFHNSSLETDRMTAVLGSSPFSVRGKFSAVSNPSADLAISSPVLHLEDLGYQFPGEGAEVKNLAGNIYLKDGNVTVTSLSGQIRSSSFMMNGNVANIGNPRISLSARFPFLKVEDMMFLVRLRRSGEDRGPLSVPSLEARINCESGTVTDIPFGKLNAELSLEHKQLLIRSLKMGTFSGTVSATGQADFGSVAGPNYRARYRLDHMDLAQLVHASGLKDIASGLLTAEGELAWRGNNKEELRKTARGSAEIELSDGMIRLAAQSGQKKPLDIPFKKLMARLSVKGNLLEVSSARIDALGGVVTGQGDVDFTVPYGPGYRIGCRMEAIHAAKFFSNFGVPREISGLLTLKGELTARGDSVAALKKTARGTVGIHLENGAINKFHVLSKIFSILNVSQLLNFRLPDMVTTGMPYNRIDGNFSVNDGIVSTSDLSVNSSSINMSVVGKSDIVKEEWDLLIGVQPLQTVGKVVSRIPVIGWILTGGKRSFLVTYYEVKGKWDDPKVSAIPVTSLTRGVFNIFKRVFSLPDKLITDTGKVIMGD
jgi:uncharacterized protein involved in outer membrane biogenesis